MRGKDNHTYVISNKKQTFLNILFSGSGFTAVIILKSWKTNLLRNDLLLCRNNSTENDDRFSSFYPVFIFIYR